MKKALLWTPLKKGDVVDIIAPGFANTPEEVERAVEYLKSWGLVARIPKDLIQKHYLCANSDEKRFDYFKQALLSQDSKAIWCLRGGYGSIRLLPSLAQMKKPKLVKPLIGISDVTSLHLYLNQKWNWPSLHAPLLDRLGAGLVPQACEKELKNVLMGKSSEVVFRKLKPMNQPARDLKSLHSSVVGGNMTVVQSSLGTPYQVDLKNKILFIEDLAERGYRVDRFFTQMHQAGAWKKCQALVIGEFLGGLEPSTQKALWPDVFKEWSDRLKFPVFMGIEAGHGKIQRTLPLGTQAMIKQNQKKYELVVQVGSEI